MALGNSILSSNNLAELEDNISSLGASALIKGGPGRTQVSRTFGMQPRNNYHDTIQKNRSFSTLQLSLHDKKTHTMKNSQQKLKMATSATIQREEAQTFDKLERQFMMDHINTTLQPHALYGSKPFNQEAYGGGTYSMLNYKDNVFLNNSNFSKYGTI